MTQEELITKYKEAKVTLTRVEQALEIQKGRISDIAKAVFEAHGPGPYDLGDGKEYKIQCRGGTTYYFVAVAQKGKKGSDSAESHA